MSVRPGSDAADGVAPIGSSIAGLEVGPVRQTIDARWLMAYAAGLGETDPRYFDTTTEAGPLAHPLFPVCFEWPLAVAVREKALDPAVAPRGVHAFHHLVIHRAPRAGDTLSTTARVLAVRARRAGTLVVVRYATVDESGRAVTTTDYGSLYRDVPADGDRASGPPLPDPPRPSGAGDAIRWTEAVTVPAHAPHVYTECARIWNPIHTDLAVARGAGLPGLILHGTATLALAVSRVVARDLDGDPARVRGVAARFTAMVPLPSAFAVRGGARDARSVAFDAVGPAGEHVLSDGVIVR